MKHIKIFCATATLLLTALLLLAGCALPFGIAQDTSVVTIQTGLMPSGARGSMPVDIESLRLVITAPDMQPIVQEFSGGDIQLEVPAGEMRVFILDAYNSDPTIPQYRGYTVTDLNGGSSSTITLEMENTITIDYYIMEGDNNPLNPAFVTPAMLPVPLFPPINTTSPFMYWQFNSSPIIAITTETVAMSEETIFIEAMF